MVAVAVLACAANALAASGYSVAVNADSPVATGQPFTVRAHGAAAHKALLYVYVSRYGCRRTWVGEAKRVGRYKAGESYFLVQEGPKKAKESYDYRYVSGSFDESFKAHAGDTAGREHACAYLATPNAYGGYRVNAARGVTAYTVTP